MKKRGFGLLVVLTLLSVVVLCFISCNNTCEETLDNSFNEKDPLVVTGQENETTQPVPETFEIQKTILDSGAEVWDTYCKTAYASVNEINAEEEICKLNWEILEAIPSEYYETYPNSHTAPSEAKLYKDGEVIEIDIADPRLVKMMNFYNNMYHYNLCGITQGPACRTIDEYEHMIGDYRIELTYSELGIGAARYPKIVVYFNDGFGGFLCVSDTIVSSDHGLSPLGRYPLYGYKTNWLELFGF